MATVWDTLTNLVSGLGGAKDKATYDQFVLLAMDKAQIEAAYRSDWIARKIVDIPPHDETRAGREWQATAEQIASIEALEKEVGFWGKLARARRLARLYGGGALVLGMKDGEHDQPLNIEAVRKGDLAYLLAFSCHELQAGEIDRQFDSPNFGLPKTYQVSIAEAPVTVHHSRVVRFVGAALPDMNLHAQAQGWGDSVIQSCYDAIHNAGIVTQGAATMVQEAKLDIVRVPNLSQHLNTAAGTTLIQNRFSNANKLKSLINTLLLDKEEEWERKQTSFAHFPELIDRYLQVAAGAADIPATRLLGQAPQGMSSTGDGDYKNYLDRISAGQEIEIRPALATLDEVLIRSALGARPGEIYYNWAPLWQQSEKERADVFKTKADAARAIAGNGQSPILMPIEALSDALVNELIEDGSLSGLEAAIETYGGLSDQEEDEVDLSGAALPAPNGRQETSDAAPRTLYVSRRVLNAAEIIDHFKAQGLESAIPADELHVTITFSRAPVDWMQMGENWSGDGEGNLTIQAGGPRMMDRFGDATVLLFASTTLAWRHEDMRRNGASWDHFEYQPHVTITWAPGVSVDDIEPWRGEIRLGPEIFAEVNDDWKSGVVEE
ncbi:phage portal protein [Nitratireductor sp. StC3]|uniref:anti-CBASS protein Acb1 family protein n=1 Tax=Nitratireductor sp. StC3 TaxID=2126741 RepID=UPI000D0D5212|nr:anti-CBASS Acb1 family protein [Nitratireductor sp. StC3]PSM18231.1 hypothetical protein C7T96_10190 [Nitratireductor sp. StC3]